MSATCPGRLGSCLTKTLRVPGSGGQPPISVGTAVLSGDAEKKVQSIGTKVANLAWRILAGSNAQCEQCNHTHTDSQYCECYRIVVQPMQPSLHGRPVPHQLASEKAAEITSRACLEFRCSEEATEEAAVVPRPATPHLRSAAVCHRHLVMNPSGQRLEWRMLRLRLSC
jgi:hypothetical protein